jgi:hypothetical protein
VKEVERIMRKTTGESEFQHLRGAGTGYVYNDFSHDAPSGLANNILHAASCRTLERANMNVDKYFSQTQQEAMAWLNANRSNNWKVCPICTP